MPRGDGRLSHELDPHRPGPQDACGVFGVWAPGEEVAKLTYFGLYALQHRGQEAAGIAVSDGTGVVVYKDLGLVAQVFDEPTLASLRGHIAIGHTRYSTTGGSTWENAQPTLHQRPTDDRAARRSRWRTTATSSTPPSWPPGRRARPATRRLDQRHRAGDRLLAARARPVGRGRRARGAADPRGAFSFVFMDENTLYAARDAHGVRPLVLGRLERGWVVASETAALDIVGASVVREVEPGELIAIDEHGLRSSRFADARPQGLPVRVRLPGPPGHHISGRNVLRRPGRRSAGTLAREHPVEADLVIPVPESGTPAAIGYAEESGIPYGMGLVKNAYVGRTFIQPSQTIRQLGIRLKLNPLRDVIRGKRIVVVDDSIVRGNTQRAIVRMLREAGAIEVHVRISSPPVKWPCFYGIDFATRAELIANGLDNEGIRRLDRRRLARLRLARRSHRRDRTAGEPAVPGLLRRRVPDRAAGRRPDRQARARRRRPQGRRRRAPGRTPPHLADIRTEHPAARNAPEPSTAAWPQRRGQTKGRTP